MAKINMPSEDALFGPWIINFASVATANITALNLTSGQATTLTAYATAYENAYEDSEAAKLNARSKVATKDSAREASEALFRSTAKYIIGNSNVSSGLKVDLGMSVGPVPATPLAPPSELVAVGYDNGGNKLTWDRNGNADTTVFLIECRAGETGPWTFVAATGKTKFMHSGQIPGSETFYRVFAQRDDTQSLPSNVAVVYPEPEVEVFTLKKAA